MHRISRRDLIETVLCRWKYQYPNPAPDKKLIEDKLSKLDLNRVSASTVNKIIGNSSWTEIRCDECNRYVDLVIEMGEEMDYESATAHLCAACLKKAYKLLK